ncbi:DUF4038 domain-containing protein [Euzebya tangerina]|uniref:apiosidase-like domain-containing protein n=1 Tax=Euzebya tangerina TaxID=591198 RepID=UPI000E318925|nr:DUF4038 domain-containing protein [Euzebya tangerina]
MFPLICDCDRLRRADGGVFAYAADTAWELIHRAAPGEIERYLDDRAAKGFTVIQTVLLAELDGTTTPNHAGELPLVDGDIDRPNESYMAHADHIISACADRGLVVGLLPTWGAYVTPLWRPTPVLFDAAAAGRWGRWVGHRFGDHANVIWILGGDRPVVEPEADHRPLWAAMAAGINQTQAQPHLCSYHPPAGHTSADELAAETWIDFHMCQSGHSSDRTAPRRLVERMRRLDPSRPCLDAEPCYEDHPIDFDPAAGRFDADDVERAIRAALRAGAAGFAYGSHAVWQWLDDGRTPISHARGSWHEALGSAGSSRVAELADLIT